MGQSPPGESCNTDGIGIPLLNGPTEYGAHHPTPVQFTTDARKLARHGDVLFCVRGSTTGRMNWADQEYAIGRGVAAIRHRSKRALQPFVRAVIEYSLPGLLAQATGSTFPNVSADQLSGLWWPPLPEDEQRAIAHILGALDDKIEVNRKMATTLDAMAQALFKSWFVDLDPVRAKAQDLVRQGVLEIGDGYRAKNSELSSPGLPFLRAGNLDAGFDTNGADVLCFSSVKAAGTKISRPGDVAFTSKGTIGRFARVTSLTEKFVYSPQVCFWRSLRHDLMHPAVLYCWMQSPEFLYQIAAVAGQTDMAPYVSLRDQRNMDVPIFPPSQQGFGEKLDTILMRQAQAEHEGHTLAALRDTLLPKLISGDLWIKDAEHFLAERGL